MERPGLKTSEFWLLITGLLIIVMNGTPYLSLSEMDLTYVMALVGGGYAVRTVKKSAAKKEKPDA